MSLCHARNEYGHECHEPDLHGWSHRCGLIDDHDGTVCGLVWKVVEECPKVG